MRQVDIKLQPTKPRLPVETATTNTHQHEMPAYADTYHATITSNWYQTVEMDIVVDEPIETVDVPLVAKKIITGSVNGDRLLWAKDPDVIINGGGTI